MNKFVQLYLVKIMIAIVISKKWKNGKKMIARSQRVF